MRANDRHGYRTNHFVVTPYPVGKAVIVNHDGKQYNCKVVNVNKAFRIVEASCKEFKFLCYSQEKPGVLNGTKI